MKFTIEKPTHLSPSHINSFIAYRQSWFISYGLNQRGPGNPNMYRGTSVEEGVNWFIAKRTPADWGSNSIDPDLVTNAVKKAQATFAMKCAESNDDPNWMMQSIEDCTRAAIDHFAGIWGSNIPISQKKINTVLDGVKIPVIGYLDYTLPNVIQDLKVSGTTPTKIKGTDGEYHLKQDYIIQGSIYRWSEGLPVEFHYMIPLKGGVKAVVVPLTDRDYEWGLQYATMAAQKIELVFNTLSKPFEFQDKDDLGEVFAAMAFPSLADFWNEKERQAASKIWSIPERANPTSSYSSPATDDIKKSSNKKLNNIWGKPKMAVPNPFK